MLLVLFLRMQKYLRHIILKCHIYYICVTKGCKRGLEVKKNSQNEVFSQLVVPILTHSFHNDI